MSNIKIKESWHKKQISSYLSQRKQQVSEKTLPSTQRSEFFPIRRDIKEIPELMIPSFSQKQITFNNKPAISYMIESPKSRSPINSSKVLRPNSPNINKIKSSQQKFQNYFRTKGLFNNNIVIRKENSNKNEAFANSNITEIVQKNNKTLEEILKYSNNLNKGNAKNDIFRLLTDDEAQANKTARIMYLHKSKKRNYSNSDVLDCNQKLSLKTVIDSFKKQIKTNNYAEDINDNNENNAKEHIKKFSFDFLSRRNSFNTEKGSENKSKKMSSIEKKTSPHTKMLKTAFNLRACLHMKKNKNKHSFDILNKNFNKNSRNNTNTNLPPKSPKFCSPLEIYFKNEKIIKKN